MGPWRRRVGVGMATMVLAAFPVGCQTPDPTVSQPPPCPYPERTIQVNGDSLALHLARYLGEGATDATVVDRSRPRSAFTFDIDAVPSEGLLYVPKIADTVRLWIASCGVPDLVIVQGGINDLAGVGATAEEVRPDMVELSDWLRDNEVPTLWVAIHPIATAGPKFWVQPERRALNAWMTSGVLWGDVVDCAPVLEDPARPDTLNPIYYDIVDIFGNVNGVHPNQAGYQVFADCIADAIPEGVLSPAAFAPAGD